MSIQKYNLAFALVLLFALNAFAQPGQAKLPFKKKLKEAEKLMEMSSYYTAIPLFESALKDRPIDLDIKHSLGQAFMLSRNYEAAANRMGEIVKVYDEVGNADFDISKDYPKLRFQYAQMLKQCGRYNEAMKQFGYFAKEQGAEDSPEANAARVEMDGCRLALGDFEGRLGLVEKLSPIINQGYTEYAPIPVSDDIILFSSIRESKYIYVNRYYPVSRIYRANKKEDTWEEAFPLGSFNSDEEHTGHGSFSSDGNRFYFTRCPKQVTAKANCAIYVSQKIDDAWREPKLLTAVNQEGSSTTCPAVFPYDNNSEILYFVSDREGGKGGSDIYAAVRRSDGLWGAPVNLGGINTPQDETTPFYNYNEKQIYFSSNGHAGYGGFDVFHARFENGRWKQIENLGKSVNSPADDLYYILDQSLEKGYLVSNRKSEGSVDNITATDDIYSVRHDIAEIYFMGGIYEATDTTMIPSAGARIALYDLSDPLNESFVDGTQTNPEGQFQIKLEKDRVYKVIIQKGEFPDKMHMINTFGIRGRHFEEKEFYFE